MTSSRAAVPLDQGTTALRARNQKQEPSVQRGFGAAAPPPTSKRAVMCSRGPIVHLHRLQPQGPSALQAITALEAPATRLHARLANFWRALALRRHRRVRIAGLVHTRR